MPPRSTPDPDLKSMPPGVPYIIGNEAAERFSFYGMKGILTVFMTKHLLDASGNPDVMTDEEAKGIYHLFTAGAYFFPILGALLADVIWGKYRTILWISLMYCVGHGALALMDLGPATGAWDMRPFLYIGLACIAVGAGGIKPCVSAHVGDQFGRSNQHLLTKIFNWFYFSINLGAAASTILTPILLKNYGPAWAFGVPGVLMAIATFVFWLGRNSFIHVPPSGWAKFKSETFSPEGKRSLLNLAPLFLFFVPAFWAIFDQTGSAWVLQAESMNRDFLGAYWLESQVQAVNPILILLLIPVFTYFVYPMMGRFFEPTPLRKIGIGFVLTAFAFGLSAMIETRIGSKAPEAVQLFWSEVSGEGGGSRSLDETVASMRRAKWDDARIAESLSPLPDAAAALAGGGAPAGTVGDLVAAARAAGMADEAIAEQVGGFPNVGAFVDALVVGEPEAGSVLAVALGEVSGPPESLSQAVRVARVLGWRDTDGEEGTGAVIAPYLAGMPSIGWQFLAYLILTSAEILVSIVCLEFAYTQAPRAMKSFLMGVYFLGVSLGNFFVSGVNFVLEAMKDAEGRTPLEGASYYWFFAGVMAVATVGYVFFARGYKGETFIQGEDGNLTTDHAEAEAEGTEPR